MTQAYIPYGAYWSSPFARWQGAFASLHALKFAAHQAKAELAARDIAPERFDFGVLGTTVPQQHSFFGLPWVTGLIGAGHASGPTINQACATGVRCLATAAQNLASNDASCALVITADKTSNGPHIYYPDPSGPGGTGQHEDWVLDNFSHDPLTGSGMIQTAENVARKWQITTSEQNEVTLRRYAQYQDALADNSRFLKRFMTLPFDVPDPSFKKSKSVLQGDEGVHSAHADKIKALKAVLLDGTVTYAGQTHPADGHAAVVVTTRENAAELSKQPGVAIRLVSFGQFREEPAMMPAAPIKAARRALEAADLKIADMAAIKSHNPFVVNDIAFARETGADLMAMNNYGCSLVWGHPQGPTGVRGVIELIEELALRGGGHGLFHGCAAGDTAMAVVIEVADS
jgi:acetyl-CoA acetyltransferase